MYQIDVSTAASTQPASTALGTTGYFTDGNAATGVAATVVPAEFLNALMLEIMNAITGAGLALSKSSFNQLYTAIKTIGQSGSSNYAADFGVANAYAATYSPTVSSPSDGMARTFKVKTTNTGASTFILDGSGTSYPIYGLNGAALQGGELTANGIAVIRFNSSLSSSGAWVLYHCGASPMQVAPATQSQHAVQLAQAQSMGALVGGQGITAYLSTAGTSVQFAIQQVLMASSIGGARQIIGGVSPTLNIATVGANGMDTGSAPVSGALAVYAIYNPATQTTATLAQSVGSAPSPVYSGANMPAGYVDSALISILSTNASGQITPFEQKNRKIFTARAGVFGTTTNGGTTWHQQSFGGFAPPGALTITGDYNATATSSSNPVFNMGVGSDTNGIGNQTTNSTFPSGCGPSAPFIDIACDTSRNLYLYYNVTGSPTAVNFSFFASAYTF
ncbi:hypothetical protein LMG28688_00839 [Paraburkholderia caffeinitolerans]|uniref:Phage tail collar domain-containing protein n=1 Tax=Paraburkholderia caffeinitolerans TaxID=1723730 RepID=A0A6J5FGZ8_9BURK|nr:hypothetical protein [Paraburkholderia caffeinitolerans]CAB3779428.1 hypothetical protein LMG28688_00839 [Paraburkholderia caffeinitolerans]